MNRYYIELITVATKDDLYSTLNSYIIKAESLEEAKQLIISRVKPFTIFRQVLIACIIPDHSDCFPLSARSYKRMRIKE